MKRATAIGLWILATVLVVLMIGAAYVVGRAIRVADETTGAISDEILGSGEYTEFGPVTVQTIRSLAELSTIEMVEYTTIEKGNDRGWLDWAQGDHIAMFAVARIEAGIDLAKLDDDAIAADRETGWIRIILPAAEITGVAVDDEATAVYDRDTGLFTKGDINLEREARLAARDILTQQALERGILDLAEDRAIVLITDLVKSLGYLDVVVTVSG